MESSSRLEPGIAGDLRIRVGSDIYADDVRIARVQQVQGAGSTWHVGAEFLWTTQPGTRSLRRVVSRLAAGAVAAGGGHRVFVAPDVAMLRDCCRARTERGRVRDAVAVAGDLGRFSRRRRRQVRGRAVTRTRTRASRGAQPAGDHIREQLCACRHAGDGLPRSSCPVKDRGRGTMKNLIARFVREEEGQDLVEYALLIAFVVAGGDCRHDSPRQRHQPEVLSRSRTSLTGAS